MRRVPISWKTAKVVLVEKPKKNTEDRITYRPISLIDCRSKLFERIIKARLEEKLELKEAIHKNQFGFRQGRATIDALTAVTNIPIKIKLKAVKNQEFCAMVSLDIQNGFNTAPWPKIVDEVKKKKVSPYLMRLVKYLTCRTDG